MLTIKILFTLFFGAFASGNFYDSETNLNDQNSFNSQQLINSSTKISKIDTRAKQAYEEDTKKSKCADVAEPGCGVEVSEESYNDSVESPDGNEKKFLSDLETMSEDNLFDYLDGSNDGVANKKSDQVKKHL